MRFDKKLWIATLAIEINELQSLQKILNLKNPSLPFLAPCLENAVYALTCSLAYVDKKNILLPKFRVKYFKNRQITMHRTFLRDLHSNTEDGLRRIIKSQKFKVENSSKNRIEGIIVRIKTKAGVVNLSAEIEDLQKISGNRYSFPDYLDCILKNVSGLKNQYRKDARFYFEALSIVRNKVSHSDMTLTNNEHEKLRVAKLGRMINSRKQLQMTFEGYRLLLGDVIRFFDNLYANLPYNKVKIY